MMEDHDNGAAVWRAAHLFFFLFRFFFRNLNKKEKENPRPQATVPGILGAADEGRHRRRRTQDNPHTKRAKRIAPAEDERK